MIKKLSRVVLTALLTMALLAVPLTAVYAQDTSSSDARASGVSPQTTRIVLDVSLTSGNGTQDNAFTMTSAEPYFKVWVENDSSYPYIVTVSRNGSPVGSPIGVQPNGGQGRLYSPGAVSAGEYLVTVTNSNSYPLKGHLAVRAASTSGELGNGIKQ